MDIETIFNRQHKRIYRIAMLYLKNESDAEDVVEDIIIKCMEKQMKFENESHENAWFITVTKNYCKDKLRAFWRRNVELGEIPDKAKEEDEERGLLEHILKLPTKYSEVLYLYYYEEYSVKEISTLLKRKQSTVQTHLATARARLKNILEEEGFDYGE